MHIYEHCQNWVHYGALGKAIIYWGELLLLFNNFVLDTYYPKKNVTPPLVITVL